MAFGRVTRGGLKPPPSIRLKTRGRACWYLRAPHRSAEIAWFLLAPALPPRMFGFQCSPYLTGAGFERMSSPRRLVSVALQVSSVSDERGAARALQSEEIWQLFGYEGVSNSKCGD